LLHVSNGESSEGGILGEDLTTHGLGGDEGDHGGILGLDELGFLFEDLSGTSVDLGVDFGELAGDVGSVAIQHGGVSGLDLTGVVQDDDLSEEAGGFLGGVVLGVTTDVSSSDVLHGETLDVETNVVSWDGLLEGLVMHFDGLDVGRDTGGGEGDLHTGLEDTGLDSTNGHGTDTTDLVDVLEGESEGLVEGSLGGDDGVQGFQEDGSLVPGHVGGSLDHVVSQPAGDGDEGDGVGGVSDLLQVEGELLLDFLVSLLRPVDGLLVHLVHTDDHLLHSEGEGQESVLSGLSVLGDTSLELSLGGGDHEDGHIGLGGTGDHVLDEVSVSWGVDDGEVELRGLELPEGDIDGDTSFSLSLELVEHPSVLERSLSDIVGLLLILLDGSLVDTTALVDQVTGRGGLSGVDVTDNHQVNVNLFLGHFKGGGCSGRNEK